MTAGVYSLQKKHPGKFVLAVDTTANELWEHNPDVVSLEKARDLGAEEVQTHYPLVNECNQRAVHVLQGYCDFFEDSLGVRVPLLVNHPVVYLSAQERSWMPQVQEHTHRPTKYWLIGAGRKSDFTAKFWGSDNCQGVVDRLRGKVLFVQVGSTEHYHPPLKNVLNLVGKTDLRQLMRLCYHADGGLGGTTLLMHLMAAMG